MRVVTASVTEELNCFYARFEKHSKPEFLSEEDRCANAWKAPRLDNIPGHALKTCTHKLADAFVCNSLMLQEDHHRPCPQET